MRGYKKYDAVLFTQYEGLTLQASEAGIRTISSLRKV